MPSHAWLQKTWATNDVPSAADANNLHADPVTADVATSESSTASTYGDLTTSGPAVSVSLVSGQTCTVTVISDVGTVSSGQGYMSFAVSGGSTLAAADANAAKMLPGASVNIAGITASRSTVFTASATGSHTFTAKYKTNGNSTSFGARRIVVKTH